jgi:hypothetical protein
VAALFGFIGSVREKELVAFTLMIAFAMIMGAELGQSPGQRAFPEQINFDRHSSLADRTQRSAKAFRFRLLAGSAMVFTPPAASTGRNDPQIFVS